MLIPEFHQFVTGFQTFVNPKAPKYFAFAVAK